MSAAKAIRPRHERLQLALPGVTAEQQVEVEEVVAREAGAAATLGELAREAPADVLAAARTRSSTTSARAGWLTADPHCSQRNE